MKVYHTQLMVLQSPQNQESYISKKIRLKYMKNAYNELLVYFNTAFNETRKAQEVRKYEMS